MKAFVFSFAQMGAFSAISDAMATLQSTLGAIGTAIKATVHGIIGGAVSLAQGGSFLQGFAGSAMGAIGGAIAGQSGLVGQYGDGNSANMLARALISGAAGCVGAVITGGKCAQAAVTAAFASLYNGDGGARAGGMAGRFIGGGLDVGLAGLCDFFTGGACAPAGPYIVAGSAVAGRFGGAAAGSWIEDIVFNNGDESGPTVPRYVTKEVKDETDNRITDPDGKMRCEYCGNEVVKEAGRPDSLQYDHMDPWSRGGGRGADNIAGSCASCNLSKNSMPFDTWIKKIWGW